MGILWKPQSDRGPLVILFPGGAQNVVIKDARTGAILERGTSSGFPEGGSREAFRFSSSGAAFNNVIVETGSGETFFIDNGAARRDNITFSPVGSTARAPTGNLDPGGPGDLSSVGGGGAGIPGIGNVASPFLLDPSLVQSNPIFFPSIPNAEFTFTDPIESARRTGAFNLEQSRQNFLESIQRAQAVQRGELGSIQEFARGISGTQRELLRAENRFNQQQRLAAAEVAIPGVQETLEAQRGRAEQLSTGRLLTTAEDRAFELTARSASADGSFVRGFGSDSVIGRKQSDLLSAQQRLDVAQIGEGFLNRSLTLAQGLLFDTPLKANISQRLPAQPNVPFASVVQGQQQGLDRLTTIDPGQALTSTVQQEQFATQIEDTTNRFNATGDFQASSFNSTQEFNAQLQQLGIVAANTQAVNTFNQNVLNDQFLADQAENFQEQLNQAVSDFKQNKDENEFIQALGIIFGPPDKIPGQILDLIESIAGEDFIDDLFGLGDDEDQFIPDEFDAGIETEEDIDAALRPEDELDDFITIDDDGEVQVDVPDFEFDDGTSDPDLTFDSEASLSIDDPSEFAGLI